MRTLLTLVFASIIAFTAYNALGSAEASINQYAAKLELIK